MDKWEEERATGAHFDLILTRDQALIERIQALRYRVFFEELGAQDEQSQALGRDSDVYDSYCDHLVVLDNSCDSVVGVCRLLRRC